MRLFLTGVFSSLPWPHDDQWQKCLRGEAKADIACELDKKMAKPFHYIILRKILFLLSANAAAHIWTKVLQATHLEYGDSNAPHKIHRPVLPAAFMKTWLMSVDFIVVPSFQSIALFWEPISRRAKALHAESERSEIAPCMWDGRVKPLLSSKPQASSINAS